MCVCVCVLLWSWPAVDSFVFAKCLQLTGGVATFDNTIFNGWVYAR